MTLAVEAPSRVTPEEAEEYTQALGQIFGGGWRLIFHAERQGIPAALSMSTREWVETRIGGYVRLAIPERREAVAELTDGEGLSNVKAAEVLGVDEGTVRNDRQAMSENSEFEVDEQIELDTDGSENSESKPGTRELLGQSDQNDWRTPRKFLNAARAVLGAIDLDPASSPEANETVKAETFYTEEVNGLLRPWRGRLWLNPPYGGQARAFIERLVREHEVGNVSAAIALVNSHPTETAWFQTLFRYTICFVRGRIDFGGPSRPVSTTSTHGSAIVYLGDDTQRFYEHFIKFGSVVRSL